MSFFLSFGFVTALVTITVLISPWVGLGTTVIFCEQDIGMCTVQFRRYTQQQLAERSFRAGGVAFQLKGSWDTRL